MEDRERMDRYFDTHYGRDETPDEVSPTRRESQIVANLKDIIEVGTTTLKDSLAYGNSLM